MTERRVTVSLSLATNLEPGVVLAAVMQQLPADVIKLIDSTKAYAFDPTEYRPDETRAFLVLSPAGNLAKIHINDEDTATNHAKALDGLLIELPVTEDYRTEASTS